MQIILPPGTLELTQSNMQGMPARVITPGFTTMVSAPASGHDMAAMAFMVTTSRDITGAFMDTGVARTMTGATTDNAGTPGMENTESRMTAITVINTEADPHCASVILHRRARYALLPGHTGALLNDRHDTVLPIDTKKNRQLESFFIDWEQRAFYIAYAALWDREAAMDAVQEAMTRLVEYYREKPAEEWPALFRTILNSKINDIRRRRMIEQGKHKLVSLTGLFQKDDDAAAGKEHELPEAGRDDELSAPEAELVAGELRSRVSRALQSLSERQRQVFILREWRGMTIRETARTLGCSENGVKQHHFRALRTLRIQLAEVWDHAQATTS